MKGIVKRIYREGSYGFIVSEGKDYFFHKSGYDGDWNKLCDQVESRENPEVEFEPKMTEKGPRAEEVTDY